MRFDRCRTAVIPVGLDCQGVAPRPGLVKCAPTFHVTASAAHHEQLNEVSCGNDEFLGACPSGWLNIGVVIAILCREWNVVSRTQARRLVR